MTGSGRTFDEATAVTPVAGAPGAGGHDFTAYLDPGWTVVGKPNGGYLQSLMARAATAGSPHPHVVSASTVFLRAPEVGAARLHVETLREGRSASQVRVRLTQDGVAKVETLFALGDLGTVSPDVQWASKGLPVQGVPFEQCPHFVPPREVFPVEILHRVALHLAPESAAFTRGAPRGLGEMRGWVQLPGNSPFDPASLLLAADVFPPAPFDIKMTGWVPTLELTTYVRALPAPGPVQVLLQANLIQGDRVDESCTIWDGLGRVVAQSHQLAGIRL